MKLKDFQQFIDEKTAYYNSLAAENEEYVVNDPEFGVMTVQQYSVFINLSELDTLTDNINTYYNSLSTSLYSDLQQNLLVIMGWASMKYGVQTEAGPQFEQELSSITLDGSDTYRGLFHWYAEDLPENLITMTITGGTSAPLADGSGQIVVYNQAKIITAQPVTINPSAMITEQRNILKNALINQMVSGSMLKNLYMSYGNPTFIIPEETPPAMKEIVKWNPKFDVVAICQDFGLTIEGITDSTPPTEIPPLPF